MTTLHPLGGSTPPACSRGGGKARRKGRRALIAAALGWMLDSFDVMLYALVLSSLIPDLGMSKETAGLLGSVTLLAAAAGGIFFGVIADRFGRTRALMASVLIYSVFTAACGFAQTVAQLAIFRILLGIGMGGEWASGAALVSETWATEHRGKALGLHAERLGDWLRVGRARHDDRAAPMGMARRVPGRNPARLPHAVGARTSRRTADLAERSAPAGIHRRDFQRWLWRDSRFR